MITGIDVSKWQAGLNWYLVDEQNHSFCFVKASEGVNYADPLKEENVSKAYAGGLDVGYYHFATPKHLAGAKTIEDDAVAEARSFLDIADHMDLRIELPPVLDIEWGGCTGVKAPQVVRFCEVWLEEVENRTGIKPIIYTGYNFWRWKMGKTAQFRSYPLWLASYRKKPKEIPGWPWLFWQYTSKHPVGDRKIDCNRFAGSQSDYLELVRKHKQPCHPLPSGPPALVLRAMDWLSRLRGFKRG